MTTHLPILNATDSPLLSGEGLEVRSTKRQIEVTMFAAGVDNVESLKKSNLKIQIGLYFLTARKLFLEKTRSNRNQ